MFLCLFTYWSCFSTFMLKPWLMHLQAKVNSHVGLLIEVQQFVDKVSFQSKWSVVMIVCSVTLRSHMVSLPPTVAGFIFSSQNNQNSPFLQSNGTLSSKTKLSQLEIPLLLFTFPIAGCDVCHKSLQNFILRTCSEILTKKREEKEENLKALTFFRWKKACHCTQIVPEVCVS